MRRISAGKTGAQRNTLNFKKSQSFTQRQYVRLKHYVEACVKPYLHNGKCVAVPAGRIGRNEVQRSMSCGDFEFFKIRGFVMYQNVEMMNKLDEFLTEVRKPSSYIGGEVGAVVKDKSKVDVRFAFCFPDTYEIGMSHLGMKILYGLKNNVPNYWCERVFMPLPDMEEQMRRRGIPLYALESLDPIKDFDFIGFTVQYEMWRGFPCFRANGGSLRR